jgi:hypothetical protein
MHTVLDTVYIYCVVTCSARHHFCNMVTNSVRYRLPYVMPLAVGVCGDRTSPSCFIVFNWMVGSRSVLVHCVVITRRCWKAHTNNSLSRLCGPDSVIIFETARISCWNFSQFASLCMWLYILVHDGGWLLVAVPLRTVVKADVKRWASVSLLWAAYIMNVVDRP